MMSLVENLVLEKAVVHFVPRQGNGDIKLANRLIAIDDDCKRELSQKIILVMGTDANAIEMGVNDMTAVSTFALVKSIISNPFINDSDDRNYLDISKSLAQKLYSAQNQHFIKDGILICLAGRTGVSHEKCVILIKAEPQNGFRLTDDNALQLINEIFLTSAQRLYKIGLWIYHSADISPFIDEVLKIYVFDDQMKKNSGDGMTQFFAASFLGCTDLVSNATKTKTFFDITTKFIEENPNIAPQEKVEKINALHVYLKVSTNAIISPNSFAETYFPQTELKNQYLSIVDSSEGITRDVAIPRDISKINNKLKVRRVRFSSSVKVSFPSPISGDSDDLFKVENYDPARDYTYAKIKGKVTN